jgi:predicted AAA+ superfamily ATPase
MDSTFEALERHNYWHGETIQTGTMRQTYLDQITACSGNRLVKVLVGQRRTGKSTILRQFIRNLIDQGTNPQNIFYLDKEHFDFTELADSRELDVLIRLYKEKLAIEGKVYLLLDEVQEIDGWEKLVASYAQDNRQEYELYITGSNSHMLSSELGTYLSGRYIPIDVYPLAFSEFVDACGMQPNKAGLLSYLKQGGLPELIHLESEDARRHYVMALRDSVLLNDIVKKFGVQDVALLERLFHFLCANIGSMFSVNKLVNHLSSSGAKTNFETLSRYVDHLERALLIHDCSRYDIRGKDILSGTRKYYLNDLAFREHLTPGFDPGLSRRLENCVFLHYRAHGYAVHVGTCSNMEVDFVVEKGDERFYVQVCYLMADPGIVEREYRSLEAIRDNYPKLVVSMDDVSFGTRNGIHHHLAWDLLSKTGRFPA